MGVMQLVDKDIMEVTDNRFMGQQVQVEVVDLGEWVEVILVPEIQMVGLVYHLILLVPLQHMQQEQREETVPPRNRIWVMAEVKIMREDLV